MHRFVASPDNALSEAERVRGEYAEMAIDQHAEVRQLLQHAYGVAVRFRQRLRDFERFQAHAFWKQSRQKPRDPSTSKWVLLFIMQATTRRMRNLAGTYAVIVDGLMQDQVEISAVASRIQELGGVRPAYEAMRARKRGEAQVSGTVAVAVAETAAAGRRTRRDDASSSRQIGASVMPTRRPRWRRPKPTLPRYPLVASLFGEPKIEPPDALIGDEWLCVGEGEGGSSVVRVPGEAAFDFVQRVAEEYAEIKEGDHKSVKRVLQRAYLATRKMQREPNQFARLRADAFRKASLHKPEDALDLEVGPPVHHAKRRLLTPR